MSNTALILAELTVMVFPALAGLYSFWSSSKKDGFDQEKTFDLIILGFVGGGVISVITGMVLSRAFIINLSEINSSSFLFGFIGTTCLAVLAWRWSLYRVLDNLATALIMSAGFWLLMQNLVTGFRPVYLVSALLLFVVYYLLQKYRLLVLKSGFTFCLTCGGFCLLSFASAPKLASLIFIGLLFTLTLVVLIFRVRSLYARTKKNGSSSVIA